MWRRAMRTAPCVDLGVTISPLRGTCNSLLGVSEQPAGAKVKHRLLTQHKVDVDRFFGRLAAQAYGSEVVLKLARVAGKRTEPPGLSRRGETPAARYTIAKRALIFQVGPTMDATDRAVVLRASVRLADAPCKEGVAAASRSALPAWPAGAGPSGQAGQPGQAPQTTARQAEASQAPGLKGGTRPGCDALPERPPRRALP